MFSVFRNLLFLPLLFLVGIVYAQLPGPSPTWCPPPPNGCVCTQTIEAAVPNVIIGDGETVCFSGNFTFTGNLQMNGGTLCVGEEVTINKANLNGLNGSWTIHNHGTIRISKELKILSGQSFYNYGTFQITTNDEFIIEEGGLYCSSGETTIEGDLHNWGSFYSSGFFYVGDEFKNFPTGVAHISQMLVEDEITNQGTIYLEGFIESLNASFKNEIGSQVIGLDHPCNAIKAKVDAENNGLITGALDGPIAIGVDFNDYSEGITGSHNQYVFFSDSPDLSEDCFRILPVEWAELELDFSADDRTVTVHWATLKEWDNSHFEVQRAEGNIDQWENIGSLDGVGFSDNRTDYSFADINLPLSGGNLYYRVRQEDLDGKSSFSEVLQVIIPDIFHVKGIWRVYPNPTIDGQMRIGLLERSGYEGERLTFRLIHTSAVTESITVSDEEEMNEILSSMVPKIPKGLFVIEISWGHNVEYIKVFRK